MNICPHCHRILGEIQQWTVYQDTDKLEKRIAELEAIVECAAKWLYYFTASCPNDLLAWEHPLECMSHCETLKQPDDWWKCWALFLMENQDLPEEAK